MQNQRKTAVLVSGESWKKCLLQYGVAAVVGAVVWGILGVTFGDTLFRFNFEDRAPSDWLADIAWTILVMPAILFDSPSHEPLVLSGMSCLYACNGIAWGLAITFASKHTFLAWRCVRVQLRRSRHRIKKGPISV